MTQHIECKCVPPGTAYVMDHNPCTYPDCVMGPPLAYEVLGYGELAEGKRRTGTFTEIKDAT